MRERAYILGAGDVVAARLLPALRRADAFARYEILHAGRCLLTEAQREDARVAVRRIDPAEPLPDEIAAADAPVFICTPPQGRVALLRRLARPGRAIILEKPLYMSAEDAAAFSVNPVFRESFCLSYYALEKALCWTALFADRPALDGRLKTSGGGGMPALRQRASRLGRLRSLTIRIREGAARSPSEARRSWLEEAEDGVLFDMGVHVFALAAKVVDLGALAEQARVSIAERRGYPAQYAVAAELGGAKFDFSFGKLFAADECERGLAAEFEHGAVRCDFDAQRGVLEGGGSGEKEEIALVSEAGRYDTLIALVLQYLDLDPAAWEAARFDDLNDQLKALDCLLSMRSKPHA